MARGMALHDNRPRLDRLVRQLHGADLTDAAGDRVSDDALQEILDASIAWVEDLATTSFNGRTVVRELYDGNGTNGLALRKRPATSTQLVLVELPVLALTRTYLPAEIKLYEKQGRLTIFTYKLGVEQASLYLDEQVYGNIFPTLPQCVHVSYTYGFPQWDADRQVSQLGPAVDVPQITLDNGEVESAFTQAAIERAYDWRDRDPELANWLVNLQQAAICDAAASVLGQIGGLKVGALASISFDGLAQTMNPQAFGPQVQALVQRRDELLARRRRAFTLTTVGT